MKRFMKGCAVTALIFAVLGSVMALVGSAAAGQQGIEKAVNNVVGGKSRVNSGRWWNWGIHLADGFFDVDVLEVDEMPEQAESSVYWEGEREPDDNDRDSADFDKEYSILSGNVDKYCPGTEIRKLDIQVGCCQLTTLDSEDGKIYLEAVNARKFQGYVEDGTLYIRSATGGSVMDWTDISERMINLYLPENYRFEEVEIEVGAGQLMFADLRAGEVSLEVGAGQIDISRIQTGELDASVGAGYMNLDNMAVKELDVEVGMGWFTAIGKIEGNADIECSMGNVELGLEGNERDYNYQLENSMGNIDLGSENFSGLSQERHIDNAAGKNIDVECSMGNITIYFH